MVIVSLRESNRFCCYIAKIINYGFSCNRRNKIIIANIKQSPQFLP